MRRLYMHVRMRTELAMVYVRVSSYYFVNTDYVEPTRQSAQRGATRQTVHNILQAWPPADTYVTTKQRMFVGRKMLNQIYVPILGLLHVMQRNSILLGPRVMAGLQGRRAN